jgi:hypothetical protein
MVENFDPTTIEDERVRQVVIELMNAVESLSGKLAAKDALIDQLRDEINRLKGEQGKPKIRGNNPAPDLSSRKERRESKPHHKSSKQDKIKINREEMLQVDREALPEDAQFKGYQDVVIQDIVFRTDNVLFRREKYYSPGQKRTYLAPLPAGYHGQFGPEVRAWVFMLYFSGRMSEPKILEVLHTIGMHISAGELSNLLIKDQDLFHAESAAVVKAGLESSPWHHLDSTATRVNGHNHHCHVLTNPLYSFYCTLPSKDRRSYLRVLLGGADLTFRLNDLAVQLLWKLGVSPKWSEQIAAVLPKEVDWDEEQINALLDDCLPTMGTIVRKSVLDALAIAAYRTQNSHPVVDLLVCDDAHQFTALTALLALCWIHEYRHSKKLIPRFTHHSTLLQEFDQGFWKVYQGLLQYRLQPSPAQAATLEAECDQLFTHKSGYDQLDECKARTLKKREQLLMVLSHPEIPLHNNPAELAARQRVRKRDVSLQARTREGIEAWDTFETLVATAKKLGVNLFHYFSDRITATYALPSLATLIGEQATSMALGNSWGQAP